MSDAVESSPQAPTPAVLAEIEKQFLVSLEEAVAQEGTEALQALRSAYFGPQGRMTVVLRGVGQLPPKERREAGQNANKLKTSLEKQLVDVLEVRERAAREAELRASRFDMTLPARKNRWVGKVHPVQRLIGEITDIFQRMGFSVARGPEVELEYYNFEALNFPPDHPARDMQDTFFVEPPGDKQVGNIVLRTHTSPVQIRAMLSQGVPIQVISPGRVYRHDSDATHSPMFHQIEGLWIDEGISVAHLRGVLSSFVTALFGQRPIRLRPSFFPFVEPGVEVDIQCVFCEGHGCRICKQSGWIEVLGAGMVHPNVLRSCQVNPERYTGFAFGLGIDRFAMLRYRVDDIAHLFRGEVRFLSSL